NQFFESEFITNFSSECYPGRVIADYGQMVRVISNKGENLVQRPIPNHANLQIAVGDWIVMYDDEVNKYTKIEGVLSRYSKFSRKASGNDVKEQIVASNVDTVFLMQSLNKDFNMKRLERYLIAAWESGALP